MELSADEWLEGWVAENIQTPQFVEEEGSMDSEAEACLIEADEAGYTNVEITEAAGGDVEAYLRRQQNAFTNSEIIRKTAKD